jgi:hypothetical protein
MIVVRAQKDAKTLDLAGLECRKTRQQVVAYFIGDRSEESCRELCGSGCRKLIAWGIVLQRLLEGVRGGLIPEERHEAVGKKKSGKRAHKGRGGTTL